jgi:hypothetical protein
MQAQVACIEYSWRVIGWKGKIAYWTQGELGETK